MIESETYWAEMLAVTQSTKTATCSFNHCIYRTKTRNLCSTHYKQYLKHFGPVHVPYEVLVEPLPKYARRPKECIQPDCGKKAHERGFCKNHYVKWYRREFPRKRIKLTPDAVIGMIEVIREQ